MSVFDPLRTLVAAVTHLSNMRIEVSYPRAIFGFLLPVLALVTIAFFHSGLADPTATDGRKAIRFAEVAVVVAWASAWLITVSVPILRSLAFYPVTLRPDAIVLNRRTIAYDLVANFRILKLPSRRAIIETKTGERIRLSLAFTTLSNDDWARLLTEHGIRVTSQG